MATSSLNKLIQDSIRENWDGLALTDLGGMSLQFRDVARKIAKLHILYERAGIKQGDKIAICGRNSAHWAVAFFSVITYGAVAVPILHEFKPDNLHYLVNHCDAKLLFTDASIWENLEWEKLSALDAAIRINDFSLLECRNDVVADTRSRLNELFGQKYPERFLPADVTYYTADREDLVLINYTSGSMGFSKGVMVPYRALESNLRFCIDYLTFLRHGDNMICMLPLAHMYGLTTELIHAVAKGCHCFFLTRIPSPRVLIDAIATVKPKLIITVPLIIEKIIKTRIFPLLDKPLMKILLKVPFVDNSLLKKVKEGLDRAFGGNLVEIITGGAGLNAEVEQFLRRIHFPYTVGYGMTECAPLICYEKHEDFRPKSCGRIVHRMEAKVDSPDPVNVAGELLVRGDNVMLGYYKNPANTAAAFTDDGWMHTGDLCTIDADGFVYIRGRSKNMILGPSGQNIYPEEIEQMLNNMPYVAESLVVDDHGRITALVYPDIENGTAQGYTMEGLEGLMSENVSQLNKQLPAFSRITNVKVMQEEFEKTPKRSIKRYLYQH